MAVVLHHIGKPMNITMAQNEAITYARRRILCGASGGGSFLLKATLTASAGGESIFSVALSTGMLPGGSEVMGDSVEADMAKLWWWIVALVD